MTFTAPMLRIRFLALALTSLLLPLISTRAFPLDMDNQKIEPDAAMLRYPDVGKDKIVFLFANDLWTVDRAGGTATPLASPTGVEIHPKFSADSESIAFGGNYDGNLDLYTLPVTGGVPYRVTHHPAAEFLWDWNADGRLLFCRTGEHGIHSMSQLFLVDQKGGLPERLPMPYGVSGSINEDGEWIAYTPYTRDRATWKRYQGGLATDIWLFNLKTLESHKITDWEGTDTLPMWHGKKLYYLSDRGPEHRLNLWVYEGAEGNHRQITDFMDYDVKWPSMGPGEDGHGEIVFQKGPGLFLLDLAQETAREVKVTIPGALPTLREKRVDAAKFIQGYEISPTGKRVVAQARGDVWTLPAEKGVPRNLTRTSGVAERNPSWSPDGKWIAYFSDATGEYEVHITQSDGKGETRQLTSGNTAFFFGIFWAPDSNKLVFADNAGQFLLHDLEKNETKVIDKDPSGWYLRGLSWSHDSRWVAFTGSKEEGPIPQIKIYDVKTGETHAVTSGFYGETSPVFDRKGDYLYYESQRAFVPTVSEVNDSFIYKDTAMLMALPLRKEMKWPWPDKSDEETWNDKKKEEGVEKEEAKDNTGETGEQENGAAAEKAPAADDGVTGTWEGVAQTP
ncbi:MAG: peptidase S41, partial [Planctomycetes bacterium]|nr:peptidase S41 [Planctomycetota bacterium]